MSTGDDLTLVFAGRNAVKAGGKSLGSCAHVSLIQGDRHVFPGGFSDKLAQVL